MKKITSTLLFIVFMSFYTPSKHVQIAEEIQESTAKKVHEVTPLRCSGTGGAMMGKVKKIYLAFDKEGEVSISEARQLIITCSDILMNEVNQNEEIRPYLENFPFTKNGVQISIYIRRKNDSAEDSKELTVIDMFNGKINYLCDGFVCRDGVTYPKLKTVLSETYEEAKAILQEEGFKEVTFSQAPGPNLFKKLIGFFR